MTAATEPSAAMDCAIVTPDKQGGESMWQHHKQSTDGSLTDNSRWGSRRGGDRRKENV